MSGANTTPGMIIQKKSYLHIFRKKIYFSILPYLICNKISYSHKKGKANNDITILSLIALYTVKFPVYISSVFQQTNHSLLLPRINYSIQLP